MFWRRIGPEVERRIRAADGYSAEQPGASAARATGAPCSIPDQNQRAEELAVAPEHPVHLGPVQLLLEHSRALGAIGPRDSHELLQAATLLRSKLPESHPALLRVLNDLCGLEIDTPLSAADCAETAKRMDVAHDTAPDLRAAIYDNESRLASARADLAAARRFAVRAVAAAESAGTPGSLWQAYFQLAMVLHERGENALAVFFGKQALAQIEAERSHFVGQDRRFEIGFLRDKVSAYRHLADWLMEMGRIEEGLAVLQLMKSEELTDFGVRAAALPSDRTDLFTEAETALKNSYFRSIRPDELPATELSRLSSLEESGKISPAERERLRSLLAGKGETEDLRAARIERLLQGTANGEWPKTERDITIAASTLARTARRFGPDTAFAIYLLTEQHLRILVTARDAQAEIVVPLDGAQLKRDVGQFLDDITSHRDVSQLSAKLYDLVARPVDEYAARHHVHRLALWLDGSLRYLPMAALQDGHRYLLDKYIIQIYSPALDANPPRNAFSQVRGLGVTQAIGGFAALPAVADELCYVVRGPIEGLHSSSGACATSAAGHGALPGMGFADAAFTEQRFRDLLAGPRDFSILHVGTHFRLRPGNALRSFLLLGDGTALTLDAIGALDFHAIDLVTLSACETGMGGAQSDDGREIEGLSALVQRRGAGRVIASLWQVEDESTAQLMRALYAEFSASHGDAALGLRHAQLALRSLSNSHGTPYADPYYWAGFSVSGSRP